MPIKCPICQSEDVKNVFTAKDQPLARYGLCDTEAETHDIKILTLSMNQCRLCGVIFNSDFDYAKVNYRSEKIQESRLFSPSIRECMINSAQSLKQTIDLKNKQIVEIGCGEGFFLSQFSNESSCTGFEPSPEGLIARNCGINVISEYFDPVADYKLSPSLIILRQVLEHLVNPRAYLEAFARLLSTGEFGGHIYIEVPNGNATIEGARFHDFYYEHYLHFTAGSLVKLMESSGFRVTSCAEQFNGEILSAVGKITTQNKEKKSFEESRDAFRKFIDSRLNDGKKVVGWGTAGNGCSFLNLCGFGIDKIKYIIDSDTRKQNLYIPGTGQLVVSPEYLFSCPPDVIVILSQFHKKDIAEQIRTQFPNVSEVLAVGDDMSFIAY